MNIPSFVNDWVLWKFIHWQQNNDNDADLASVVPSFLVALQQYPGVQSSGHRVYGRGGRRRRCDAWVLLARPHGDGDAPAGARPSAIIPRSVPYAGAGGIGVETTTIEAERQDAAAESRLPPRYSWCLSARTSVPHGVPTRLGALAAERTAEESPDHAAIRDAEQVDRGIQPPAAYLFARAHRARCPLGFGSAPTPSTRENPAARFAWPSRLPVDGGGRDHRTTLFSCVDHSLALMNRVRTDESPVAFDFSAAPGRGPTGWSFRSSLLWPPMMPTATATAMRVQGAGPPAGWTSGRVVHLGGNPVLRNRSPGGAQRRRCRLGNARLGRSTTMLMMDQPTTLQWTTARDEKKNRFPSL
jgi:hypothetical protein